MVEKKLIDSRGYRLITTTYTYYPPTAREKAIEQAKQRRGEGKRTEVITETEYAQKYMGQPMQDLTKL